MRQMMGVAMTSVDHLDLNDALRAQILNRDNAPTHHRSRTSTAERARDTQQQITVLLARSALLRQ